MDAFFKWYGYALLSILFTIVMLGSLRFQDRIALNDGKGYDGQYYYDVAEQLQEGTTIRTESPQIYRLGTPFLASLLPFPILDSFLYVNMLASFIGCLLLYYWLSLFFKDRGTAFIFVAFFMLHWLVYPRLIGYYPATCDPVAFVFIMLLLILLRKLHKKPNAKHYVLFGILAALGVFVREFILLFCLAIPFLGNPIDVKKPFFINFKKVFKKLPWFAFALTLATGAFIATHALVDDSGLKYTFGLAIYRTFIGKTIFLLTTAIFLTYGVSWVFLLFFWKDTKKFYLKYHYLLALAVLGIAICWFGGGDTERFFIWFFPVFMLPLGRIYEKHAKQLLHPLIIIPVLLTAVLTLRLFWPIAQPLGKVDFQWPFFQSFNNNFEDHFSWHSDKRISTLLFAEYFALSLYLFFMIRLINHYNNSKRKGI
ncbi:hypothetical protein ACFQ1M_07885 [Sungkyunkwania multivorans]|uniref:Glycosyltransferase RgtA/B/C/D-like domain-containing protein n=1 Tax=Sungkyunkwania multivorans TaxID=1173618 RepID=A0ABW3CYF2_9FLAO